jgi:hypothetical protein
LWERLHIGGAPSPAPSSDPGSQADFSPAPAPSGLPGLCLSVVVCAVGIIHFACMVGKLFDASELIWQGFTFCEKCGSCSIYSEWFL